MKNKTKKRNPNDTTFRNINALKKQVAGLKQAVRILAYELGIVKEQLKKKSWPSF